MRIGITGEKGFIARNLAKSINNKGFEFVSLDDNDLQKTRTGETCVYRNTESEWTSLIKNNRLDFIVHNAATVGTDVVALNPVESISTNVLGTQTIVNAANNANIPVLYTGTTVIYDTLKYQNTDITEKSDIFPRTNYAVQKYAGEMTVRNNAKQWLVARPLFAYGGVGDMNSLISKTLFSVKNKKSKIDMFLDPQKIKDYMHVTDFCNAVVNLIKTGITNHDFNIAANNPYSTEKIVDMMSDVVGQDVSSIINWHEQTDYLGNHRLTSEKYIRIVGMLETTPLKAGIMDSWNSINKDTTGFNPLKYLEEASDKNVDLKTFFPTL